MAQSREDEKACVSGGDIKSRISLCTSRPSAIARPSRRTHRYREDIPQGNNKSTPDGTLEDAQGHLVLLASVE